MAIRNGESFEFSKSGVTRKGGSRCSNSSGNWGPDESATLASTMMASLPAGDDDDDDDDDEMTGFVTETTVAPVGLELTLTVTEMDVPGGTTAGTARTSLMWSG